MTLTETRAGAIGALIFLGISSLIGAIPMLLEPSGTPLHIPLTILRHSPFESFLIPGLLLLISNGLLSFVVLWVVIMKRDHYGWWVIGQGVVLSGWLVIEVAMLRGANWLHALYGLVAAFLVVTGWRLRDPSALT